MAFGAPSLGGMRFAFVSALFLLATGCSQERRDETPLTGAIVEYGRTPSGGELRGVLYRPPGDGSFPVLIYAHGSAPGALSHEAFEAVAPAFTSRGWAVFAPYRRGQGLSRDAGPYVRDEVEAARKAGGMERAQAQLARLLAADHMDDQSKAFAWLSRQPFAERRRIAVMGNSFGGIIALLSAERLPVCAAVDAAGAAESWKEAPALQALMKRAAKGARAPVLFIQAENDFDLAPSLTLFAEMRAVPKESRIRIYPAFGKTARDGHAFAYRGVEVWAADAHDFLARACPREPRAGA
jgi:dienelactone hydrolase